MAIPTFIVDGQRIAVFQAYQILEQFVIDSGAWGKTKIGGSTEGNDRREPLPNIIRKDIIKS